MELKVMETMDYNLFSKFNGNRDVKILHVNRIAKSMTEQFLIKPIDVNEKYEVIDGQHRLEACKETGLCY
jgi:ParB-like chromosome segregation protein Spo0J